MTLKVLDLFSGIGGFSLGLERTGGFETVAFCEIEPYCQAVLRKHWPEVPIYDDVRKLTVGRLAADGIEPDVICGGFPCQDISVAGKGEGIEGERSGLWSEFARLIGEIRPQFAIVENVSALLGRGMDVVLGDLAALRYDAEWHCIPASAVGAPHRRDRVWIVAYPAWLQSGWKEQRSKRERTRQSREPEFVADAIGHELRQQPGGRDGANWPGSAQPRDHGATQPLANPALNRRQSWREGDASEEPRGRQPSGSSLGAHLADALSLRELQPQGGIPNEWGRAGDSRWWLVEPDMGRVAHGVPSRVDRLKCLGNAVVPQIPEIIGHAILAAYPEARLKSEAKRSDTGNADCRDACLTHTYTGGQA